MIDYLEELGCSIRSRIPDGMQLDRSSQSAFNRSVLHYLTVPELKELAKQFPLEEHHGTASTMPLN